LVENGLAIAVVPRLTLPRKPAKVVGIPLDQPAITRTIGLVRRTGRSLSPAAEAFERMVTQASRASGTRSRARSA
jgi:DNA-binding transcriptional LysR family regulator